MSDMIQYNIVYITLLHKRHEVKAYAYRSRLSKGLSSDREALQ